MYPHNIQNKSLEYTLHGSMIYLYESYAPLSYMGIDLLTFGLSVLKESTKQY